MTWYIGKKTIQLMMSNNNQILLLSWNIQSSRFFKLGSDSIYCGQNIVHNITKLVLFSFAVTFNILYKSAVI